MERNWTELVAQAKEGNNFAIEELYLAAERDVYIAIRTIIKDEDTAQSVMQDAMLKGFKSLDLLKDPNSFIPWMKKIGKNKALDNIKKHKKEVLFSDMTAGEEKEYTGAIDDSPENMPEKALDRKEAARLLNEATKTLKPEEYAIFTMFEIEHYKLQEISDMLGVNLSTVKTRKTAATKKVKAAIEKMIAKEDLPLYGITPVAILFWLISSAAKAEGNGKAMFPLIMEGTAAGAAAGAGAAVGAGVGEAAVVSGTIAGKSIAGLAGTKLLGGILSSVGVKVGLTIATVAAVGTITTVAVVNHADKKQEAEQTAYVQEEESAGQETESGVEPEDGGNSGSNDSAPTATSKQKETDKDGKKDASDSDVSEIGEEDSKTEKETEKDKDKKEDKDSSGDSDSDDKDSSSKSSEDSEDSSEKKKDDSSGSSSKDESSGKKESASKNTEKDESSPAKEESSASKKEESGSSADSSDSPAESSSSSGSGSSSSSEESLESSESSESSEESSRATEPTVDGSQGLSYTLNSSGTYTVTGIGTCSDSYLTIPSSYDGIAVTQIGENAFSGSSISGVSFSGNITSLGRSAFQNCKNLSSISLPTGISVLDVSVFSGCSALSSLTIPANITNVYNYAFKDCTGLTTLRFTGYASISQSSFEGCTNLQTIYFPQSFLVQAQAFRDCENISTVYFAGSQDQIAKIGERNNNATLRYGDYNGSLMSATWVWNS